MPSVALVNAVNGAFGINSEDAVQIRQTFKNTAGSTISKGDAVILKLPDDGGGDGVEVTTTTTADSNRVIGIAAEDIEDDAFGPIVIWGIVEEANVADASAAGDLLGTSATAGRLATGTTTHGTAIALALTDATAANTATVFVSKV